VVAGSMYFFKDDSYYLFNGKRLDIEDGYPRLINEKWAFCTERLQLLTSVGALHAATHSSLLAAGLVLVLRLYTLNIN